MPRRHCKTCGNPLHADDTHRVCVTLGEIPCWRCAQRGWLLALRAFQSCLSALTVSFLFRERLRPSHPPVFFLPGICEKKQRAEDFCGQWQASSCRSMPACLAVTAERERAFVCPLHSTWSASLRCERHDLVWCEWRWKRIQPFLLAASDVEECLGSVTDPALLTSSSSRNAGADEELICIITKVINELWLKWSPLRSHLAAGWTSVFSWGAIKAPRQPSSPFFPEVHTRSRYYGTPPTHVSSVLLLQLLSHPLTALKKKDTSTCRLLDESVAAHCCPPTAIGWKVRASHPSKPCRVTSALAGHAYSGGWTSGFSASLDGCAPGLPGLDARQWGSRSGFSLSQGPEERDRPGSKHHQSHHPSYRALDVQPYSVGAPPLAHDDRDERGGQSFLPRRSDLVRQPVWTSCGGLCWTLHGGSEVVSGDATLPP